MMRLCDYPAQKVAYTMIGADGSGANVTYGELDTASIQGAHLFRELGIQPGDGIAIWLPNHEEFLKISWAAQRSGIYYTPISTYFKAEEVSYILDNSDAKLLITNHELLQRLPDTVASKLATITIDEGSQSNPSWQTRRNTQPQTPLHDESEGAEMFYSSGTTGRPKGVRFPLSESPYGTVSKLFDTRIQMHKIDADTKYLSTAPMYHSAPLRYNMIVTRSGGTAYILEKFDPEQALRTIDEQEISHSQWVPTMFVRLLKLPPARRAHYNLSSLRYAIHAAAPCPIEVKRAMIDWFGPVIYEYYSGTEANGFTAITTEEWLAHPGSVGKAVHGNLHILDDDENEMTIGETGGVYFGNGADFSYYKDPIKTASAKTQSGLSTLGDIGYLDEEGYLYLKDRKSFMIISGGVNIYPQEIEDLLITHPMVKDVAVFGIPNTEFGEEVKAVVELVDGELVDGELAHSTLNQGSKSESQLAKTLIEFCRDNLSHIKCPKSIDFTDELPRHPTGKLYKQELKRLYTQNSLNDQQDV